MLYKPQGNDTFSLLYTQYDGIILFHNIMLYQFSNIADALLNTFL